MTGHQTDWFEYATFQVWFLVVVQRCYGYLQRISLEKPSLNGTSASSVTQENGSMKV